MNTSLVGLAKIGAVVFSSSLSALFVYDRATGGAFYRELTDSNDPIVNATPVSSEEVEPVVESAAESQSADFQSPRVLFSGSKSYSGHTNIASGTLESPTKAADPRGPTVLMSGSKSDAPIPPTLLMSGSKTLILPPAPVAGPPSPPNADAPPKLLIGTSKSGTIFVPSQPAAPVQQTPPASKSPRYVNAPPYAGSPAYANVPLTPADAGGPRQASTPPATSPPNPPRPTTIMMGSKSAPVFSPPAAQQPVARQPAANAPRSQPRFSPAQQQAVPQSQGNGRQVQR